MRIGSAPLSLEAVFPPHPYARGLIFYRIDIFVATSIRSGGDDGFEMKSDMDSVFGQYRIIFQGKRVGPYILELLVLLRDPSASNPPHIFSDLPHIQSATHPIRHIQPFVDL